ncbi:MAG TPA: alcohol dehydrogenase catalytic domain-containing protein [Chloroflexota bacterium]|nr:alcohol dehydrogenase catalytic domain-containing protein [Chloroflexota bacterium]
MKAAVYRGPHDIAIEDRPVPRIVDAADVLVRVRRAGICGSDAAEWDHGPVLARPPVVLGHEFMGEVVDCGPQAQATGLAPGQRVVSGAGVWCARCEWCAAGRPNLCASYQTLGFHVDGGLAEYVCVPSRTIRRVPDGVDDDAAALAQPLAVALHAVDRSRLTSAETCVVIGVGGIGSFVVAAARARGAGHVVAIDVDARRLEAASALGADSTYAVHGADLEEVIHTAVREGPHVVIEASGSALAPGAAIAAVRRGGRIVLVGLQSALRAVDLLAVSTRELELVGTLAHVCDQNLPEALSALQARDLARLVVDRTISLAELVPVGIATLLQQSGTGKFLIDPTP